MDERAVLALAWLAGAILGAIFFGGLWWTVRMGLSSRRPALWFASSLLVRMALVLAGFFFIAGTDWRRLLLCLVGFVMAREFLRWTTRARAFREVDSSMEAPNHAPQP